MRIYQSMLIRRISLRPVFLSKQIIRIYRSMGFRRKYRTAQFTRMFQSRWMSRISWSRGLSRQIRSSTFISTKCLETLFSWIIRKFRVIRIRIQFWVSSIWWIVRRNFDRLSLIFVTYLDKKSMIISDKWQYCNCLTFINILYTENSHH